jgi:hypothetical protein
LSQVLSNVLNMSCASVRARCDYRHLLRVI